MSRVAIVIVNWDGKSHLERCLPSVFAQTHSDLSVVVVDNGSKDGSVPFVQDNFPQVQLLSLPENLGFAHPNNLGIRKALEDEAVEYVVTLNNDTELQPDYLSRLLECAEHHPEAGSIQAKVLNYYEKDRIDCAGILIAPEMSAVNRGINERDRGQYNREEEIFGPSASAALYRRSALETVALRGTDGGRDFFDGDYFAYYEDVDLAWRLRLAGFSSFYAPKAQLYHVHSATGKSFSPFKAFHIHRNLYFNIIKNLPFPFLVLAFTLLPIRYLLLILSVLKKKGPSAELAKKTKGKAGLASIVLRSWKEVLFYLPKLIEKRSLIQGSRKVPLAKVGSWYRDFKADYKKIIFG